MKKFFVFLFVQLLLVQSFFAQEFAVGSGVTEMVASQTLEGNTYVFYVQDEMLKAIKHKPDGSVGTINLFSEEEIIENVNNLQVYKYYYPTFMCFGKENGKDVFISFEINEDEEIKYHKKYFDFEVNTIEKTRTTVFSVVRNAKYFSIINNSLYELYVDSNEIRINPLSKDGEFVQDYDVRVDDKENIIGFYKTTKNTKLFYLYNNINNSIELKNFEEIHLIEDKDNLYYCSLYDGTETQVYSLNNGVINKIVSQIGNVYFPFNCYKENKFNRFIIKENENYSLVDNDIITSFSGEQYPLILLNDYYSMIVKDNFGWNFYKTDFNTSTKEKIQINDIFKLIGFYVIDYKNNAVFIDKEKCEIYFVNLDESKITKTVSIENCFDLETPLQITDYIGSFIQIENGENSYYLQLNNENLEKIAAEFTCYTNIINNICNFIVYNDEKIIFY